MPVLAPEGILEWLDRPCAVRYVGTYDRTYFAYQNQRLVQVNYFDHGTKTLGTPTTLHTYLYDDAHGSPALVIFPVGHAHEGKLLVFYAQHGDPLYCNRSTTAESLTFDAAVVVDSALIAYPHPHIRPNGEVLVEYRSYTNTQWNNPIFIKRSTDGGSTWGARTEVVADTVDRDGNMYCLLAATGDEIHLCLTEFDGSELAYSRDIGHMWSPDGGVSWQKMDGTPLPLPVDVREVMDVYHGAGDPGKWSWVCDITASPGDPRILFYTGLGGYPSDGGSTAGEPAIKYARWSGGAWVADKVCSAPSFWSGFGTYPCGAVIDPADSDVVLVMQGNRGTSPDDGTTDSTNNTDCTAYPEVWRHNGNAWGFSHRVPYALDGVFGIRPQFVRNAHTDFDAVWVDVYRYTSYLDWRSALRGGSTRPPDAMRPITYQMRDGGVWIAASPRFRSNGQWLGTE